MSTAGTSRRGSRHPDEGEDGKPRACRPPRGPSSGPRAGLCVRCGLPGTDWHHRRLVAASGVAHALRAQRRAVVPSRPPVGARQSDEARQQGSSSVAPSRIHLSSRRPPEWVVRHRLRRAAASTSHHRYPVRLPRKIRCWNNEDHPRRSPRKEHHDCHPGASPALAQENIHLASAYHRAKDTGRVVLRRGRGLYRWRAGATTRSVSTVLTVYGMALNDSWTTTSGRNLSLHPTPARHCKRRSDEACLYLALDRLTRTYIPAWLDLAGFTAEAAAPDFTDREYGGAAFDPA